MADDVVISRARARADEVLPAARAQTDHQLAIENRAPRAPALEAAKRERVREEDILLQERASAYETLHEEPAEHVVLLSRERSDTDTDLAHERARSDNAPAMRDEFLGIVSHDLRNMLNAVGSYADLIAEGVLRARILQVLTNLLSNAPRGVGLGLYISRAIVEGHGGRIWAENRVGGGSTFCFTLPMQSS